MRQWISSKRLISCACPSAQLMNDKNTANGHYRWTTGPAKIALYGFVGNSRICNISVCRLVPFSTEPEDARIPVPQCIALSDKTLRADLEEQCHETPVVRKSYMKARLQAARSTPTRIGVPTGSWQDELIAADTTLPCRSEQSC
ncbi:hypothetical protein [Pseudomonas sp. CFBP 13719]|uniref:hypothetical protein n=1 Tax=Pseudomonas sp. CFBP 13719 TaxID=2775303 RepID=UPI001FD3B2D3|nr:hypothetical protein [Pseudomonas sp. CFBP 13719]